MDYRQIVGMQHIDHQLKTINLANLELKSIITRLIPNPLLLEMAEADIQAERT